MYNHFSVNLRLVFQTNHLITINKLKSPKNEKTSINDADAHNYGL